MVIVALLVFVLIVIYHKKIEAHLDNLEKRVDAEQAVLSAEEQAKRVVKSAKTSNFVVVVFYGLLIVIIFFIMPPVVVIVPVFFAAKAMYNSWSDKTKDIVAAERLLHIHTGLVGQFCRTCGYKIHDGDKRRTD